MPEEHATEPPRLPSPIDLTGPTAHQTEHQQYIAATVKLTSTHADDKLGCRQLVLTQAKPTCPIGRASNKRSGLAASASNAYFENAVVSRCHAELQLDLLGQRVTLKDKGSLHGTFHNDTRLRTKETRTLRAGDTITLGAPIERGHDRFQPYKIRADIVWETSSCMDKPVTYTVPDDTDVEDNEDDYENEKDLDFARSVLLENGFEPPSNPNRTEAVSSRTPVGAVVDLTVEQTSTVVEDGSKNTESTTIVLEEPDLYSDHRIPIRALSPEALWYSDIADKSSEYMLGSSDAEDWGPYTPSDGVEVSPCGSESGNDVGAIDLDDELVQEGSPDSDIASPIQEFDPDEISEALSEEDNIWGEHEDCTADTRDPNHQEPAQASSLSSATAVKPNEFPLIDFPSNTKDTETRQQPSSMFDDLFPQSLGTSDSFSIRFAPIYRRSDSPTTTTDHAAPATKAPKLSPSEEHLLSREANRKVLGITSTAAAPRPTLLPNILSDVCLGSFQEALAVGASSAKDKSDDMEHPADGAREVTAANDTASHGAGAAKFQIEPTIEGGFAPAEHKTTCSQTLSRKRGADMISKSTSEEEQVMVKAAESGVSAERGLEEPALLPVELPSPAAHRHITNESNSLVRAEATRSNKRPAKRIRRSVAEAAGYVALGGVLAWSALIATAPAL